LPQTMKMIKIVTIIGARPQIIKAAALSRAIAKRNTEIKEKLVHTGQHYDENMSAIFFDELGIPKPDYNLNAGSGSPGVQTAKMISGIEEILLNEKPNCLVVYGDTNSTLAGAVAASKINIPVVHIEAGLRSFNKLMPEEINRISCDHVSTLMFTPTDSGINNLSKEGFNTSFSGKYSIDQPGIFKCGDIMYDNSLYFSKLSEEKTDIIERLNLKNKFVLATIHRNTNTDEPKNLNALFSALNNIAVKHGIDIVLPLHPRTSKLLETVLKPELLNEIKNNNRFKITSPVSFLEMIALEKNAEIIMTDSGGVQKEAYFFNKCCVILREETEWIELTESGYAILTGAEENKIITAFEKLINNKPAKHPDFYGDGKAAEFMLNKIIENFS
jgi:UDP-GlcNAc3NAcA epimerase